MTYACNTEGCSLGDCPNCVAMAAKARLDWLSAGNGSEAVPNGYTVWSCALDRHFHGATLNDAVDAARAAEGNGYDYTDPLRVELTATWLDDGHSSCEDRDPSQAARYRGAARTVRALQAEVERLQENVREWMLDHVRVRTERDALQERLDKAAWWARRCVGEGEPSEEDLRERGVAFGDYEAGFDRAAEKIAQHLEATP